MPFDIDLSFLPVGCVHVHAPTGVQNNRPAPGVEQVLYYYRTGINALKSKGYVAGKNLHGMGFDFRCSMAHAQTCQFDDEGCCEGRVTAETPSTCRQSNRSHSKALLQKLEAMREANGGARINIVSHSMGGLVTKLLLAQYPQAFERLVRV